MKIIGGISGYDRVAVRILRRAFSPERAMRVEGSGRTAELSQKKIKQLETGMHWPFVPSHNCPNVPSKRVARVEGGI